MALTSGTRLGPYEIVESLGAGGMGEVYRAHDPRLRRDVALKVILEAGESPSRDRLKRFEDEARAVAALSHPNVLTVFDVGSDSGRPYVVFELLEGTSLREVLEDGPLPLRRAVELGIQVCRGLEAAHTRDLVHRDLKPENLFLTSDGLVKILDFGLAKLVRGQEGPLPFDASAEGSAARTDTAPGTVLGTLGYLSPEQVRGHEADARSDLFSLGAVLFEMVSGQRAFSGPTAADTLSAILHGEPSPLVSPSGPVPAALERIVRRCLEKDPRDRFHSAHDVALALEAAREAPATSVGVSEGPEERSPYPGLRYFTEDDAGRFFGREGEIEALWERLKTRALVAVIGPSGAGKSSFIRAGVVASRPTGWGALVCTPGSQAFRGLGEALAPELAGDPDALKKLLEFEETAFELVTRWRSRHTEALLVVDQLEELYTLNRPEVQERFPELVGRLANEGDVHVVLSLRDDFLMRCGEHEALQRVFTELTPLYPLSTDGLRRAVEEPAKREGFSFEEGLVEEMLEAVEGARGALPLLAFAVSRLWEKRDREEKVLTRAAYEGIGGVAGALAQHAEQTLERIGSERQPLVRELFRNLVTAQGTRSSSEREELLSVFPEKREAASDVLQELIGARLLTSYEVTASHPEGADAEQRPKDLRSEDAALRRHRIEVVHESLLKAWPRLVMWQAQDEEGAVLRDQLRQAAHLWEEKERSSDVLWTGRAFREFELWRERYPGKLTALEEEYARAMVDFARRRTRLRRAAVVSLVVGLAVVAVAIAVSREQALEQARRAEAARLVALSRLELDRYPTAALAFARKSLDVADSAEARRFAVEALWRGPTARILPVSRMTRERGTGQRQDFIDRIVLSADGRWLATAQMFSGAVQLFPRDGGPPRALPPVPESRAYALDFGPRGDLLITGGEDSSLQLWSLPDRRALGTVEPGGARTWGTVRGEALLTLTWPTEGDARVVVRQWPLPEGEPRVLMRSRVGNVLDVDSHGTWLATTCLDAPSGRDCPGTLWVRPLDASSPEPWRLLGQHRETPGLVDIFFVGQGDRLASSDDSGEIRLWSLAAGAPAPLRVLKGSSGRLFGADPQGTRLATGGPDSSAFVWNLGRPPYVAPTALLWPDLSTSDPGTFDPTGRWLVTGNGADVAFWPLVGPMVEVLRGPVESSGIWSMAFTPDGRWLVAPSVPHPTSWFPLDPEDAEVPRRLPDEPRWWTVDFHPAGTHVLFASILSQLIVAPIEGGPAPDLFERGWEGQAAVAAFDEGRGRVVGAPTSLTPLEDPADRVLKVWDLDSGEERVLSLAQVTDATWKGFESIQVAPDGSVFASGFGGVRRLTLPTDPEGTLMSQVVYDTGPGRAHFDLSRDGRLLLAWGSRKAGELNRSDELVLFHVSEGTSHPITTHAHPTPQSGACLDPSGRIVVSGGSDGVVRVGPVTGEEPHLLFGHTGPVTAVTISPDGRFIASAADDSIRLWPMPDVEKPPLHTLPYEELMTRLRTLTNLDVVEDETSPSGYRLEVGAFPGWEEVPTW